MSPPTASKMCATQVPPTNGGGGGGVGEFVSVDDVEEDEVVVGVAVEIVTG